MSQSQDPDENRFDVTRLLDTRVVTVRHVHCSGACRHRSAEECASATVLVFPLRGLYLRHVGSTQSVADANSVLFFNAGEGYRVSHPIAGGDDCLTLTVPDSVLREIVPAERVTADERLVFRTQSQRIDARTQALAALLHHSLRGGAIEPLEAESLALTLVRRAVDGASPGDRATPSRRKLVDRVKVLLASDLSRRWSLSDIAAEIGGSPVYLTQAFQQVERMPLYRYQLQLRLARALDRLPECEDLAALAHDLGFSSHSHFASSFRQAYGRSPAAFRSVVAHR